MAAKGLPGVKVPPSDTVRFGMVGIAWRARGSSTCRSTCRASCAPVPAISTTGAHTLSREITNKPISR